MLKGTAISRNLLAVVLLLGLATTSVAQSSKSSVNDLLKEGGDTTTSDGSGSTAATPVTRPDLVESAPDAGSFAAMMSASGGDTMADTAGYLTKLTPEIIASLVKKQGVEAEVLPSKTDFKYIRIGKKGTGKYIQMRFWKGKFVFMEFQYLLGMPENLYNKITLEQVLKYNRGFYLVKASKYESKYKDKTYRTLRLDIDVWIGNGIHANTVTGLLQQFITSQASFLKHFNLSVKS